MTMKSMLIILALVFSANAFAQDAPKAGKKQPVQVKPKAPVGCIQVGSASGRKLWWGDCIANELRRNEPTDPMGPLPRTPGEEEKKPGEEEKK